MQNKKLLVVAIGAALAIPCAYAQRSKAAAEDVPDSVVELYGKAYPEWVIPRSGNGPTAAGTQISTITNGGTVVNGVNTIPSASAGGGQPSIIKRNEIEASNTRLG